MRDSEWLVATGGTGRRPDRAVQVINNLRIYPGKKVLENFCARLRTPIRHVLQACQDRLSIAALTTEHYYLPCFGVFIPLGVLK